MHAEPSHPQLASPETYPDRTIFESRIGNTLFRYTLGERRRKQGDLSGENLRPLFSLMAIRADGSSVDLLPLINPHRVAIYVSNKGGPEENFHQNSTYGYVTSPPLTSPLAFGALLHELGHTAQDIDKKTAPLTPFYPSDRRVFDYVSLAWARRDLANARLIASHFNSLPAGELIDEVERLIRDTIPPLKEQIEGQRSLARMEWREPERKAVEKQIRLLESRLGQHRSFIQGVMRKIFDLPKKFLERDATKRALEQLFWLRDELGIDLLQETEDPSESLNHLFACLETYHAGNETLKHEHGTVPTLHENEA